MWSNRELDSKESWALNNWCFWTVVSEKILESPLDCEVIQPLNPKRNKSWIFIGRADAEAVAPTLWPPDAKNWLIGKDSDAGKDWRWEKGTEEDEMAGWHHRLDGHQFEWTPGVGDGQGGLACCRPHGSRKESDTTERLHFHLDSILKSRDITLPTKVHLVKSLVFPIVMYGCESWTIKKAEQPRIDAFELWCWRRLLKIP